MSKKRVKITATTFVDKGDVRESSIELELDFSRSKIIDDINFVLISENQKGGPILHPVDPPVGG